MRKITAAALIKFQETDIDESTAILITDKIEFKTKITRKMAYTISK